ncbi:MAG: MAPEG family protein [Steroidobacteraceae bacterium]
MYRNLIFYPILVQVALTLLVYVHLIRVKIRAIKAGQVDKERRALHEDAWPDSVLQINNCIRNQFEIPVLFYVVAFVLWALEAVGIVALVVAWLFVLSRLAHAWIHLTSNYVPNRRRAFTVGWWLLVAMVLLAAWRLIGRAVF